MDHDPSLKMTINVHHQCCFASIIINTINTWRKYMILQGMSIDHHHQCRSSINVPPLIEGDY